MPIFLDSKLHIQLSDMTTEELKTLRETLRVTNPQKAYQLRIRPYSARRMPDYLYGFEVTDDEFITGVGALSEVQSIVPSLSVVDNRLTLPPLGDVRFLGQPRDYQVAAIDAWVAAGGLGSVTLPTGGGKSFLMAMAVARTGQPTCVLVPSLELLDQIHSTLTSTLSIDESMVGRFGGKRKEVKPITVCTYASAAKNIGLLKNSFGLLICDEAHHASADTLNATIQAFGARHKLGLTATPTRRGSDTHKLGWWALGAVVYKATPRQLIDRNAILKPVRVEVPTSFECAFSVDAGDVYSRLEGRLLSDVARNKLIIELVASEAKSNPGLCLVLTSRVSHARHLHSTFESIGLASVLLVGELTEVERRVAIADIRNGFARVIVASSVLDEGISIDSIQRLFLTAPGRSEGRYLQRIGRVLRRTAGKSAPIVFDVVDPRCGLLANQSEARARAFVEAFGE